MGHSIAYIRVSSIDQNPARQIEALPETDRTFLEKASGATANRPQLKEMLEYIRQGDVIHVHSIDRLARNIEDLNRLVKQIVGKGCAVKFHKENLAFGNGEGNPASELLFNVLGSFAQFERSMIKERQAEGQAAARAAGKHMGRPGKLTDQQKAEILKKREAGATPTELAKEYGVSRATVYNVK